MMLKSMDLPRILRPMPDEQPCCASELGVPTLLPLLADPVHDEREERRKKAGLLNNVFDAHVHLLPDNFYAALWRWFDNHAWHIVFRGNAEQNIAHLQAMGTSRLVALVYAHRAGTARFLNEYLGQLCRSHPQIVGVGTVLPGEPDALRVVREAIDVHGLRGIKLHCHVQKIAIDAPEVLEVLELCQEMRVPAVVHAGREPASDAYGVDARKICSVAQTAKVLQRLPNLRLIVPHIGADEFDAYLGLLDVHENLHLDTAMACASYFSRQPRWSAIELHADRILYGTDFPIIPYAADRELRALARNLASDAALAQILRGNAAKFWMN